MNVFELLSKLIDKKQAVPSFNFTTADVALAIAKAIKNNNYHCLLSTSERELNFLTMEVVVGIVDGLKKQDYPVFLNLDHGKSPDIIKKAVELGYDCIHFDGSNLPLDENIRVTKEVIALCKQRGISVEGEVGTIGGSSTISDESQGISILTNPQEAIKYVKETGVNLLACSFGSYHGLSSTDKKLKLEILEEIKKEINIPFVLHGGSGISADEIKKAINCGVVKINFNTELRLAWSNGIKEYQQQNPSDIVPANELAYADLKVTKIIEEKLRLCMI